MRDSIYNRGHFVAVGTGWRIYSFSCTIRLKNIIKKLIKIHSIQIKK